jgi:hypothetical protein
MYVHTHNTALEGREQEQNERQYARGRKTGLSLKIYYTNMIAGSLAGCSGQREHSNKQKTVMFR